jgi:DHA2 family multidrug resistance protein
VLFAASAYWMSVVDANTSFLAMVIAVIVSRVGQSLINPTLNVTALRSLQSSQLRQGAGMINFSRQLGGAFGINLLSVSLDRRTLFHSSTLASMETPANGTTAELLASIQQLLAQFGADPGLQSAGALHYLGRVVYAQAYTLAFRDNFLIVTLVFLLALIPAWVMGSKAAAERVR